MLVLFAKVILNFEMGEEVATMSGDDKDRAELMGGHVEREDLDKRVDTAKKVVAGVEGVDTVVAVDFCRFGVDAEPGTDKLSFRLRSAADYLKLDLT